MPVNHGLYGLEGFFCESFIERILWMLHEELTKASLVPETKFRSFNGLEVDRRKSNVTLGYM